MKEKNYSYEELDRILKALNLYSRVLCGQYEEFMGVFDNCFLYEWENTPLIKAFKKLRNICIPFLRDASFSTSLGIWGPETPLNAIRAYDIYQILRYQKSYHEYPDGGYTVNFNSPFIHGNWNIRKPTIETLNKLIEPYHYRDYYPLRMQRGWECPLVIIEFNDDKQTLRVLRDVKKIDSIIHDALNFYELILQRNLKEAFMILYPEKGDDKDFIGILEEIDKQLNSK